MPRSPPPPAINAVLSPLSASLETEKASDLPLRNFATSTDETAPSEQADRSPPILQPTSALAVPRSDVPGTPSSTIAEYGDDSKRTAKAIDRVIQSSNQHQGRSRSQSGGSKRHDGMDIVRTTTPTQRRQPIGSRSHSVPRNEMSTTVTQTPSSIERSNRFLHTIPQSPRFNATEELLVENRGLHQRISALQRTEQTLLKDIQDLSRRLAGSQQRYDNRRQHWKEELRNRETTYEARVRDLEAKIAKQDKELKLLQILNRPKDRVPDEDIASWFSTRTGVWHTWAQKYANQDPTRVQSGLHPLQMRELCEGVKGFVRLTEDDKLPRQLVAGGNGVQAAQLLLASMLANFIMTETLESPFWVFDVVSADRLELESPSVPRQNSVSPVGFRMDLGLWNNSSVARPRTARLPQPTMNAIAMEDASNARQLPRLNTSIQLPGLNASVGRSTGILDRDLPSRQEMEGLYHVFCNIPGGAENAHAWRSRLIKAFSDGGMSLDMDNIKPSSKSGEAQSRRLLAESRKLYATRLKDHFLRGAARFLLEGQDAAGIEKLERELVQEIDAALRFSCQLWSRQDGVIPCVKVLKDLSGTPFSAKSKIMELCQSQAPAPSAIAAEREETKADAPPEYHDGDEVVVVVQPAVEAITAARKLEPSSREEPAVRRVWSKARVLVAAPAPLAAPVSVRIQLPVAETPAPATTAILRHPDAIPLILPPLKDRGRESTSSMSSAEILLNVAFKQFDPKGLEGGVGVGDMNMKPLPDVPISLMAGTAPLRTRKGSSPTCLLAAAASPMLGR
ncbi:hypothetical protein QBC44DRAFT_133408 [Cladorrhinum sp. PSN332]|nr:hypothetical protein QBC44DRAFT_133408 [Cladorrhinum sp. PSN332]